MDLDDDELRSTRIMNGTASKQELLRKNSRKRDANVNKLTENDINALKKIREMCRNLPAENGACINCPFSAPNNNFCILSEYPEGWLIEIIRKED